MKRLSIYFSASISNAHNNSWLADFFDPKQFEIFLPQEIVPDALNHTQFPLHVYQQCVDMMQRSDIGLVLFDAFGRDCAWECGWYAAQPDKLLIGYAEVGSLFMRDWMVKGGLDAFITPNPRLYEVAQNNPILQHKALRLLASPKDLPQALHDVYQTQKS